jgi:hypothetical protein
MDAQRLYLKHRRTAAIRYYLLVWALPIIGVFATVPFLLGEITHDSSKPMAMYAGLAAGGAWFAIFIPINRWFTVRRCWKAVVPPERVGKPITLEFTDESVISTIPGQSEGRFFWTAIPDFVQNDRITLLFVRKKNFLFIPTKDIPPEQWAYVRAKLTPLLNRNL